MKKELMLFLTFSFLISLASATCDLEASLLNQDPYPAVPGDYVELVFQIDGVENTDCGLITFELLEKYPIEFDPGTDSKQVIQGGTYTRDRSSFFMAPYKVRVDADALDGDNTIEVDFSDSSSPQDSHQTKQFNLNVEDVKVEFEIFVKNYDSSTNEITFQILNIEENDIYALTLEIPKQEGLEVKGANRNIVGDLDSNDYTTTTFEAIPEDGEITLNLIYTDEINERRTVSKKVTFDSSYFEGRIADKTETPWVTIIIWILVILGIGIYIYKRQKKKKKARG